MSRAITVWCVTDGNGNMPRIYYFPTKRAALAAGRRMDREAHAEERFIDPCEIEAVVGASPGRESQRRSRTTSKWSAETKDSEP